MGIEDKDYYRNKHNTRSNLRRGQNFRGRNNKSTYQKRGYSKGDLNSFKLKKDILKIVSIISVFLAIFIHFNDMQNSNLVTSILLLVFIVASYKSWIWKYSAFRRHKKLVIYTTYACTLLLLTNIIPFDSSVGQLLDVLITILSCYVIISITWLSLIYINNLNLASDLNCWGVKILGLLLFILAVMILSTNMIIVMTAKVDTTAPYIFTLLGMCLLITGIFSEFRAKRRNGTFVYLR